MFRPEMVIPSLSPAIEKVKGLFSGLVIPRLAYQVTRAVNARRITMRTINDFGDLLSLKE
ncbi:MAG: hypothetical protein ACOC4C_03930 [Fibrobacterota bacterium]